MPELPEIETVRLQLQKVLPGQKIKQLEVLNEKTVHGSAELVKHKIVKQVTRVAKVLIVELEGGVSFAFHFKMTGQLIYLEGTKRIVGGHPTPDFINNLPSSHTRAIFHLSKSKLFFNDQRKFGWIKIGTTDEITNLNILKKMGPEPFNITESEFIQRVSKSKRPIKLVIMDQEIVSGVGNIYANDALWEAKTDPIRPANTLTSKQYHDLYEGIVRVLTEGIQFGGATAADAKYMDLHGLGGHYQDHFRTYDRTGKPCLRDQTPITKITLGGRGTYYCHRCQK
jgi:formamidopyrimidine-DNA glycosylase